MNADQLEVVVFVKDTPDISKYFRLFRVMLGADRVTKQIKQSDFGVLETNDLRVRFYIGGMHMRGVKAHYVINMVQDVEFNNICALAITNIHNYLKEEPKWNGLFNDPPEPYRAFLRYQGENGMWRFKSNENEEWNAGWWLDDLEKFLAIIKEEGWNTVFSDEKGGFYTFTKERIINE